MVSARNSGFPDIQNPKQSAPDSNRQHLQNHASTTWRDNPRLGRSYHRPPPHIRAVRASSQASRAAGASRGVAWADAPPVGAWKCIAGAGRGVCAGGGRFADAMGVKARPSYQSAISTSNWFLSLENLIVPFQPILFFQCYFIQFRILTSRGFGAGFSAG